MEMPIASTTWQKESEIRRILCFCSVNSNTVLAACLGTTDLFQILVEDDTFNVANQHDIGLQSPAESLQYAATLDLVFALSATKLLVANLSHDFNEMSHPINQFIPECVACFDIVIVKEGVFIAVLVGDEVRVLLCTKDAAFLLSRFHVGVCVSCKWLTGVCLSCTERGTLKLYCVLGTFMHSLGSSNRPVVMAGPLQEFFEYNGKSEVSIRSKRFFVVFGGIGMYFSHRIEVFDQDQDHITKVLIFPIFATSPPKCVFSIGPWICVGGLFGIEFYDCRKGSFVQSILETVTVEDCSFSHITLDLCQSPNDYMYSRPRHGVAVTDRHIYTLCLHSILDVVDEIKEDAAFNADLLGSLIAYGDSVQAEIIMRSPCRRDSVSSSNFLFSEYGSILAKFRLPSGDIRSRSSSFMTARNHGVVCAICGRESNSFISHVSECAICKLRVCQKCSFTRPLETYGYNVAGRCGVVCAHCDGGCDFNLYRLFMARRFSQILQYMQRYPENCSKLTLSEVIPPVLEQCFQECKYDLCAQLLETYVPLNEDLWGYWISRFGMMKQMKSVVFVHDPSCVTKTINTGLLLQLVKTGSDILYFLLQRWPSTSYDKEMLLKGVLSRLSYKKAEAQNLQSSCQTSPMTISQVHNSVSNLYYDDEIICLLRVLLYICFQNEMFEDAAKGYMEYFIMMLPFPDEKKNSRGRTSEVFDGNVLHVADIHTFPPPNLIDFWDLITSHNLLESFAHSKDTSGTTFYLVPLLIHFREEFGQYLINSVHVSFLEDILRAVVSELRENQPTQLLQILDALDHVQPHSTIYYHSLMSELYMDHAPEKFFSFLQNPLVSGLDWKKLAKSAEKWKMFRELVYIIGKIGDDMEAVRMAIRCMKSVSLALEYIKDHDEDPRLRRFFAVNVIQSPVLIGTFLDIADDSVNVEEVLREIPRENRIEIDRVGPRLHKVFSSKRSTIDIADSAVAAINEDTYVSMITLRKGSSRAARCSPRDFCCLCGQSILGAYVVNGCGQSFHTTCGQSILTTLPPIHNKRIKSIKGKNIRGAEVSEKDCIEYLDSMTPGISRVLTPLSEVQVHYILSFLTVEQREVCRSVSRGFRKAVKNFYRLFKGAGDNIHGRYRERLESKEGMPCRKTVFLPLVPSFV